jgi:hypothetical protein
MHLLFLFVMYALKLLKNFIFSEVGTNKVVQKFELHIT